jgi:2-polyprenyl-3-methyl-5-hydroxy-6-metoxy-1,4-benzoquinol methylase
MELDSLSEIYDGSSTYQYDNKIILERYPKQVLRKFLARESLLELGLGHGFSAMAFSNQFGSHTVIEGSEKVISQHKKLLEENNIQVIHSYFEDYETEEKYDLIVAGFILEHVQDPKIIVEKYLRFLKPKGMLVVAVPNSASLNRRIGLHAGLISDLNSLSDHDRDLGHLRYFDRESLTDLIINTGGKIEFLEGIFLKVASSIQLQNLNLSPEIIEAYCEVGVDHPDLCCALLVGIAQTI